MKKEIKKKWLTALRSGKYKQTNGALKDKQGFCCLGVLCDVHRIENKKRWAKDFHYYGEALILPTEIINWAGLKSNSPDVSGSSLAELNDYGETFEEIADLIEKQL